METYGLDALDVRHYVREAAVRQKIEALGGRREAQARDVFDLQVLLPGAPTEALLQFLVKALRPDRVEEAYSRALAISYREYEGQVFEFLGEKARSRYGTESAWDEIRLRVAALIENVSKRQGPE